MANKNANEEIRERIKAAGLKHWEVALAVGVCESTFCAWLRRPLVGDKLQRTEEAIATLIAERK